MRFDPPSCTTVWGARLPGTTKGEEKKKKEKEKKEEKREKERRI
jgi:hypothetical protein